MRQLFLLYQDVLALVKHKLLYLLHTVDSTKIFDKKKYQKDVNIALAHLQSKFDVMSHDYLLRSQVLVSEYQCLHSKIDNSALATLDGFNRFLASR